MKKNLLVWCWGRRGGAPFFSLKLLEILRENFNDSVFLSISKQSELYSKFPESGEKNFNISTYSGIFSAIFSLFLIPMVRVKFGRFLIKNNIDLVICPFSHLWNFIFIPIIKRCGSRYILFVHDASAHPGEKYFVRNYLLKKEIAAADGIIVLSEYVKNQLILMHGYSCDKIWNIPHAVYEYADKDLPVRGLLKAKKIKLLFFGRILPYKGLNLLLDAYPLIKSQVINVELHILGSGSLEAYQRKLCKLDGVVINNSWIKEEDVAASFADKDIVLLPYIEASQSGVIAVAAGFGIPAVITPVGGLVEQVRHELTGVIASEISAPAFAEALIKLCLHPDLYEKCSKNLLKSANTELSWDVVGRKISEIINYLQQGGH